MNQSWAHEIFVDEGLATRLIREQFDFHITSLTDLGHGWDNAAFLVNEEYVFRFPRRQVAVDLLLREADVLPHIAPKLPLAIPHPLFFGKPSLDYPWPFQGYKHIPGLSGCFLNLSRNQRSSISADLACFLKDLHSLDVKSEWKHVLPIGDKRARGSFQECFARVNERLEIIIKAGAISSQEKFQSLLKLAQQITQPNDLESLVHGDLYARHLLLNDTKLAGIIDWGDMHIGDPAIDLAIAYGFLPRESHKLFLKNYGPIGEEMWHRAKLWALYSATAICWYGHDANVKDLKREGQMALEFIKEETT
ncbi:MAG: phosphotransferase [Deltaproteobacteria bacterium]|nr:phosphotransferase [Deltaproteobacteria bacterium]